MPSLPSEFVNRIREQFPDENEAFLSSLESSPTTSIQLNPRKSDHAPGGDLIPWCANGRLLEQRPSFTYDPLFHAGCYYPQESSSMFLYHILDHLFDKTKNIRALDLCAAPGGKSLIISGFTGANGLLVSNEINKSRNQVLRESLEKWAVPNFIITQDDASRFSSLPDYFDLIVVDAPCSGEGLFRKNHEARDEWSVENVLHCSARQKKILGDIYSSIAPGGYLIYSTCTFAPEENENNLQWITSNFAFEKVVIPVPYQWNIDVVDNPEFRGYRFLPHRVPGEGLFISALQKKTGSGHHRREKKHMTHFHDLTKKESGATTEWITPGVKNLVTDPHHHIYASAFSATNINYLSGFLHITQPGLFLGTLNNNQFIPGHALALSGQFNPATTQLELTLEEALKYLRGDNSLSMTRTGWAIVTYKNVPLGWIKGLGNRVNNYYPKEYRIRR